jgi:hypothetical protein
MICKPVHVVAKLLGLAPYTFVRDTQSHQETIDISWKKNRLSVVWSLILLIAQAIATSLKIASTVTQKPESVLYFFTETIRSTAVQLSAVLFVFLALTTHRTKMLQLVSKLSAVDMDLNLFSDSTHKKHEAKFLFCFISFTVFIIPTYGCFTYFWESDDLVNSLSLSLADFTWLLNDMEFVNVVMLQQEMLSLLNKRIGSVFSTEIRRHRTARERGYRCFGSISELLELPQRLNGLNTYNSASVEALYCQSKVTERIVNCRRIYNKLYDICCFVNGMYGFTLLLSCVTHIVCFVSDVNSTIRSVVMPYKREGEFVSEEAVIPLLVSSLIPAFSIIAITLSCQKTSEEYQECVDSVQELLLRANQKDVVTQLRLFCNQLENNRIKFTAYGFFAVDLSLLTTLTGVTVTYVILLVQV